MSQFIALYRGINVGGNNPVKMEALRALHERLGHKNARSYIQSGNVVFSASGTAAAVAKKIAAAFADEFGFAAKVLVTSEKRWQAIVADNPYSKQAAANPKTVHAGLCDGTPDAKGLKALLAKTGGPEAFVVGKDVVYLHAPDGVGNSRFAAGLEKACGAPLTMRNWRTIEAIATLLDEGA